MTTVSQKFLEAPVTGTKIKIRQRICACWSESLLVVKDLFYLFFFSATTLTYATFTLLRQDERRLQMCFQTFHYRSKIKKSMNYNRLFTFCCEQTLKCDVFLFFIYLFIIMIFVVVAVVIARQYIFSVAITIYHSVLIHKLPKYLHVFLLSLR